MDDTIPRSVKAAPSLPDASHRNVVLALHAVRLADKGTKISDRWLKSEHRIGQDKQAARLLRYLSFVDTRRRLTDGLLSKREDWDQFRRLLIQRVREGCEENGIESDGAAAFGSGWDAFQDALIRSAAFNGRSDRSKSQIVSCFRALADVCEMTEKSFSEEVARVLSPAANDGTNGTDSSGACQEWSFPIGRQEQGKIVYARVAISDQVQPGDFRRLAEILKTMDIPAPGSGELS
jgi:hypothetical protein